MLKKDIKMCPSREYYMQVCLVTKQFEKNGVKMWFILKNNIERDK